MLVGHTHDDIDALFGRWSMQLKQNNYPTIPLLMKSFMDAEAVPIIPHLIRKYRTSKVSLPISLRRVTRPWRGIQKHSNSNSTWTLLVFRGCNTRFIAQTAIGCHGKGVESSFGKKTAWEGPLFQLVVPLHLFQTK